MRVNYDKYTWEDRIVARPRTYDHETNADDSVTHTPNPGEVIQTGTPIGAEKLNHMEQGIADCAGAVNELEETKLEEAVYSVTVPATGWVGAAAPYSIQVNVTGILASDTPLIDAALTGDYETDAAILDAYSLIYRIVAINGALAVDAYAVPGRAVPLTVRCLRHG